MIDRMNSTIANLAPMFEQVNWSDDMVYGAWLSQAYYIARQSTSFLGLTMIHSRAYPEYLSRCTKHIQEETGHERLIENDLKQLGQTLGKEFSCTSAIYQTQYYRIVAQHPMSFVGYVFFLELLAPAYGPMVIERVSNKRSVSFLKVHTAADEDHIQEASKLLEIMPNEARAMAQTNFDMTAGCYQQLLVQLQQLSDSVRQAA